MHISLDDNFKVTKKSVKFFEKALETNTSLTYLTLWNDSILNDQVKEINRRLEINKINKKRLQCLQILCLEKLNQLNRINEIKVLIPTIYESCLSKYL